MTENAPDRGPLIVVSGPSGSGKTTIIHRILAMEKWPLRLSVSVTTREPRPGEQEDVDYRFWSKEDFIEEVAQDGFLEYADVFGFFYGTLKREVDRHRNKGFGVLLDIDVQGWEQVRRRCPDLVSLFVRTSSLKAYEERLRRRGTETEDALKRRMEGAARELSRADEYDFQIINDDLTQALEQTQEVLDKLFKRDKHVG